MHGTNVKLYIRFKIYVKTYSVYHMNIQFYQYLYLKIDFKLFLKVTFCVYKLNCFNLLCNIFFREHLPEDGHNRWPKHVAGYAVIMQ
jgi:hypothetical protein